jgi:hypothetical protein|tara:strand:+ start:818 stop:940 length:123 start_codon:yes stop_codon:yes gene_type:complete
MFVSTWTQNIITEVGFALLGGVVAVLPVYLLGMVLRNNEK